MRRQWGRAWVVVVLSLLPGAPSAIGAQASARRPVATTPHFAFYSDAETNLNDALLQAGVARKSGKAEPLRAGPDSACFARLPAPVRAAWNRAVDYYADIVSPTDFGAAEQYRIRMQLAGFPAEIADSGAQRYVAIVQGFRAAAAPAYRACRWAAQDSANRAWIARVQALLAAHEATIAPRLEQLYRKRWPRLPMAVDVVQTVNWAGANSVFPGPDEAPSAHLLVSVENEGLSALESVFHEASHGLMLRGAPVRLALDSAARGAGYRMPGDLWHVVQFHTTGEVVRRALEAGGTKGYATMLEGIMARPRHSWAAYRQALEDGWVPYVTGRASLGAAAAELVRRLREAPGP